jgi:hypothetical protein
MTLPRTILGCIGGLLALGAAAQAEPVTPAKLPLGLPLQGKKFSIKSVAFSAGRERLCIAGDDYDEMGKSTARVLLIDRADKAVRWQKTVAVPEGLATLFPVQCLVGKNRVYLLANADTSLSPPQARTQTHVFAFDMHGKQTAARRLEIAGMQRQGYTSEYGYALNEAADGMRVAGYTRDQDGDVERYATYTMTLDAALAPRGLPVVRMNGAYTYPPSARIVGESVYLAGRFFKGATSTSDLGSFSASRLKVAGGYIWSTPMALGERMNFHFAVADDGSAYALGHKDGTTTLTVVTRDGKAQAPLAYVSAYCRTKAIARYDGGIVAVRTPCAGRGRAALVWIDVKTGRERQLKLVPDEPLEVEANGNALAVVAAGRDGALYLYSMEAVAR